MLVLGAVVCIYLDKVFARQARFVRWRTSLNKEMLVVGGVGGGKTTHPTPHLLTNQHPPTCTHLPMKGRFDSDNDPKNSDQTTHPVTARSPINNA